MIAMGLRSWKSGEQHARVELPTPEPRAKEIRVAVHAAGVNPVDWKMRSGGPLRAIARTVRTVRGPRGPVILGVDFAGVVDAVGAKVTDYKVGDRVYGGTNFARGQHGSYADTVVVRGDQLAHVPEHVPFDVAGSMVVTGVTAWMAVSEYRAMEPGRRVLVLGAAGGVGQLVTQFAKRTRNADLVVGVCSGKNAELVRSLGADAIVDYTAGDALALAKEHGPFDLIVDCAGGYAAGKCRKLLAKKGAHVMVAGDTPGAMLQVAVPPFKSHSILGRATTQRLQAVIDAVAAGQVVVNIAERMPLAEVEAAHAKSQTHRLTGKLVLLPR